MRHWKWIALGLFLYALISAGLGVFLCDVALHPGRRPLSEASEAVAEALAIRHHSTLENVEITQHDGVVCKGWYFQTPVSQHRAVMVLHGLSDNRSGMIGYIELFLANGYDVLAPDWRAHGASGGNLATYGLLERQDVMSWLQWLSRQKREKKIYGLGESMGAAILLQSLQAGAQFRAVVAEASFCNFREIGCDRISQRFHLPLSFGRILFLPAVEAGFIRARQRFGIDLSDVAPERACRESETPILLIHGETDSNIPFRHALRINNLCGSRIHFWAVPNGGHASTIGKHPTEFARRVLQFFSS